MAGRYQITCINQSDRLNHHERIRDIGGINADGSRWKISHDAAIEGIETRQWCFFISRAGRDFEVLVAMSKYGRRYLKTAEDRLHPESLLALPECP
ncbi:MAG: DUF3892 domain-containing protein [Alphaproteobacteria bacterium]|nr:DUF3892 domain-containing protein [Alphaproteobacteria bacterium]